MQLLRSILAVFLICDLCLPASFVAEPSQPAASRPVARRPYVATSLTGDRRILHALDRFTFGPRPGDFAAVRAMGLEAWFESQLHPAALDEPELNARLAGFPAMRMSIPQLLAAFPSGPMARQAARGDVRIPPNGILYAVYENAVYRVNAKKDAQTPATQTTAAPVQPPDAAAILALAPAQRVARLAAMQPAEFAAFMQSLRPADRKAMTADLTPGEREATADLENPERTVTNELLAERLARDIYANAQLQEVMTDFWLNHFSIYLHKNEEMPYYLAAYARDVIRPRALGKFEDLLEAVAHSPAMLTYLDNAESTGPDSVSAERAQLAAQRRPDAKRQAPQGLNENYARELMELHTLGVNGGYTQADVTQVARVLTGWTIDRRQRGGDFQFSPARHEPGTKKVLNKKIKENGEEEGEKLLHMLATSPATAHFLSRKLAIRFVGDDPSQVLVDRMAKTYLATDGDIPAVLRTLFRSPEFWTSADDDAKVKTPLEFVVSAVRASNADVQNYEPLINALRQMGMPIYGCIPPIGYNWQASAWVSTGAIVDRLNFALALAANRFPGITVTWAPQTTAATPEAEEARLEPMLIPAGASDATRSATLQQFRAQMAKAPAEREDQVLAGLLLGSPEFQRR